MRELVGEVGLRNDVPSITEGVDIGPEPTPFQQAQELAAERLGSAAHLVPDQRRLAGQSHDLPGAGARRRPGRRPAQRPLLGDRRPRPQRHAAELRRAGARPRARDRPLPDAGRRSSAALDATPGAVGAMVVSPTYFGACADVAGLAAVAHEHGVPLAVDEAWGAHLRFHPDLPPDALSQGADLVVSSTHKIVGSLTQAAMLHLGRGRAGRRGGRRPLRQPGRNDQPQRAALRLAGRGPAAGERPRRGAARRDPGRRSPPPARRSRRSPGSAVLDDGMVGRAGIAGWDPLRLAIDVRGTGSTGYRLAKVAFELDDGIDLELAAENVVVAIFGLGEPAAARRRAAGRRPCARRSGGSAHERGRAAAGAAGAAAALGRAGDDAARGLPRPAGGRPLRRRRRDGSRPSRWPPTRPAFPTSSPASASPARRSTTSPRASATAATCAAAATAR